MYINVFVYVNKNVYIIITLIKYQLSKNIVNNLVYVTKILMTLLDKTINLCHTVKSFTNYKLFYRLFNINVYQNQGMHFHQ